MKNMHFLALASLLAATGCTASTTPTSPSAETEEGAVAAKDEPTKKEEDGGQATCTPLPKASTEAVGMVNPATKYCADLGYQYGEGGTCVFPDGTTCNEWDFFQGSCGGAFSFCAKQGGTVSSKTEDMGGWTGTYAVCTLQTGASCKEIDFAATCECK